MFSVRWLCELTNLFGTTLSSSSVKIHICTNLDVKSPVQKLIRANISMIRYLPKTFITSDRYFFHLLPSSTTPQAVSIGGTSVTSSTAETLLGIITYSEFKNNLPSIWNKMTEKTNARGCIGNYMSLNKHRTLIKTFIDLSLIDLLEYGRFISEISVIKLTVSLKKP